MSMIQRDWGVIAGVLILLITGSSLVMASPIEPPARPLSTVPVTECELVQLAVYELDAEASGERGQEQYNNLTDIQRSVFNEARTVNGDFVRFKSESRMAAADTLPSSVVLEGRAYRAHSVRGNCFDRPWYIGLTGPVGYLLVGLGMLVGGVFSWRRITY